MQHHAVELNPTLDSSFSDPTGIRILIGDLIHSSPKNIQRTLISLIEIHSSFKKFISSESIYIHLANSLLGFLINTAENSTVPVSLKCLDLLCDMIHGLGDRVGTRVLERKLLISRCLNVWDNLENTLDRQSFTETGAQTILMQNGKLIIYAFVSVLGFEKVESLATLSTAERLKLEDIKMHMAGMKLKVCMSVQDRLGSRMTVADQRDLRMQVENLQEEVEMSIFRKAEIIRLAQRDFEQFVSDHVHCKVQQNVTCTT